MIEAATRARRTGVLLAVLALAVACGGEDERGERSPTAGSPASPPAAAALFEPGTVTIETATGQVRLNVEIARTDQARQRGLMGRTELGANEGMVFLFDDQAERSFWMKDTLIPLSIAFFDEERRIVSILEMTPCEADPCPLYDSGAPAAGAIEANAGFFRRRGVKVGDRVRVHPS